MKSGDRVRLAVAGDSAADAGLVVGDLGYFYDEYVDQSPRARAFLSRRGEQHSIIHVIWDKGVEAVVLTAYGDQIELIKENARWGDY